MSLAVYILVALAAADGVKPVCEVISLGDELVRAGSLASMVDEGTASDVVALGDGELDESGSTSSAICEGLRTSVRLLCSVHVVSSEWQPVVFRPQVNVLCLPSSLQAVIATPVLGLSVHHKDMSAGMLTSSILIRALFTCLAISSARIALPTLICTAPSAHDSTAET
jgi:hypothetical protein